VNVPKIKSTRWIHRWKRPLGIFLTLVGIGFIKPNFTFGRAKGVL
jgi:hypothetical protein